jgi:hypothetical protein
MPKQVYNIRTEIINMNAPETSSPIVQPGLSVQVEIAYHPGSEPETERLEFVIVPDELADFPAGFLGQGTPLAQAILGEPVGRTVPYFTGDALSVTILSASQTSRAPDQETAARRQERLRRALEQSDRTSAMIFASSFSGKWGDYDPQGIEKWDPDAPTEDEKG